MLLAVLLSAITTGGLALVLGAQQRAESDRRWCALLGDLDAAYAGPPKPSTVTGRKVAEEIHRLRVGFGCPAR